VLASGPLLLVTPLTFALLPFLVAVATRIYIMLVTDPDQPSAAGQAIGGDFGGRDLDRTAQQQFPAPPAGGKRE
jgi:hypothetical protein